MAGAIIGGAATIGGALIGAKGSKDAAKKASSAELKMYYQSREDLAPWRETGEAALEKLWKKTQKGPGSFRPEETPGYKFGFEEFIEKPMERGAAKRGRFFSPGTTKALTRYAEDYGEQGYDNFLRRHYDTLKPLQSLANVGQTGATDTARMGTAAGANAAMYGYGGDINRTNALMAGISGLGNIGANYAQQYYNQAQPKNWLSGGVPIRR